MGTSFIFWQYHSVGMSYHSFIPPLNLEGSSRAGWDFLYAVVFLHMHEYIHMQCPLPFGQLHINFLGLILAYNDHMLPSLKRIPTCMLCLPSVHTKSYGQRAFSLCTYSLFLKLLRAPERRGAVQILFLLLLLFISFIRCVPDNVCFSVSSSEKMVILFDVLLSFASQSFLQIRLSV